MAQNEKLPVKELNLSDNRFRARGAASIGHLLSLLTQRIKQLVLNYTRFGNEGIVQFVVSIEENPHAVCSLEVVYLHDVGIDHVGAKALCTMIRILPRITALRLYSNNIECKGVVEVAYGIENSCGSLREIDLSSCDIGDDGCMALGRAIASTCRQMPVFRIESNNIGAKGAKALVEGLTSAGVCSMEYFDISLNPIGNDGAAAIGAPVKGCGAPNLNRLKLTSIGFDGEGIAAVLGSGWIGIAFGC